jgi:hypothetical protein
MLKEFKKHYLFYNNSKIFYKFNNFLDHAKEFLIFSAFRFLLLVFISLISKKFYF